MKRCSLPLLRQRGVSIIAAIFMLLLLSGLAALMVTLTSTQNITSAQDIQGARAYQAARLGIQWGVYQVMNPENTGTPQYGCAGSPVALHTASPAAFTDALAGFNVNVACSFVNNIEGANQIRTYTITSTASAGVAGSVGRVERELTATVVTCRQNTGVSC